MNHPFRFKQFNIYHDRCKMKVGTDGVLLGAIADPASAINILDAGTGSGLIALMMAQKTQAQITGIDIDADSVAQAMENGAHSPWANQLQFVHSSIQDYASSHGDSFDMIICNPPFFADSLKSLDQGRNLARHDVSLSFDELLKASNELLRQDGKAWFIYPFQAVASFSELALKHGFTLYSRTIVSPKEGKAANRSIDVWMKGVAPDCTQQTLCVHHSDDTYTQEYKRACSAYYLFF